MTLLNLRYVTQSLITLIEQAVKASPEWGSTATTTVLTVSPRPPDLLRGSSESNVLAFYLYYISEDSYFKNLPPPGIDSVPVRYSPMGLILHYQLTAHAGDTDDGVFQEQLMMGLATKALHDYPIIDDSTEIIDKTNTPIKILDTHLAADNRFRISLLPLPYNEVVSYWTAGSNPLRLAAYYEVAVVLLEPEESKLRASRVLTYDVFSFIQGAPRLYHSYNRISFTIPGETATREATFQPAEVTYGNTLGFKGNALTAKSTSLLINNPRWDKAAEAGPAWSVTAKPEEVKAKVQTTIDGHLLLPGMYSAQVKVIDQRRLPDGSIRTFEKVSNITPFIITPQVDTLNVPDAAGVLNITGAIFKDAGLPPDNVQVYVAETRLQPGTYNNLNQSEFAVIDAGNLQIRLPGGFITGQRLPFRLIINGTESAPQWIQVP